MSTTAVAIERYRPFLSELEQTTLLGFLAGYRGFTREAYALDLPPRFGPPSTSPARRPEHHVG